MDHVRLHPPRLEPARQPEAVAAGFEGKRNPRDSAAGPDRLILPAVQHRKQPFRARVQLLARLTLNPGSTPATSQLDWLSSTTAMIVLFWSRATRDLLKSFGWGIAALHRLMQRRSCHFLAVRPIASFGSARARTTPGSASCAPPGESSAPAARPSLERDQAAPGFGEEGEHCRRVITRRATASKARPELGALLGLKAVRFDASNAVL